ncbi:MAG: copper chaperone NosL [Halobacteriales archaeon]|jgi:copper chaperone NosL
MTGDPSGPAPERGVPGPVPHWGRREEGLHGVIDAGSLTRREVLAGTGATVAASLAGCSMLDGGSTPAAVSVGEQASCDVCGMVISKHPGPNGQIFYEDQDPQDHDPPFRFDSLKACAFDHYFRKKRRDWSIEVFYVTDYSSVDYSLSEEGGKSFISGHGNPGSFAKAKSVSYVLDADVYGAMGTDFVPFSDEDEASDFAEQYGGTVVPFGDITPATLK